MKRARLIVASFRIMFALIKAIHELQRDVHNCLSVKQFECVRTDACFAGMTFT